MAEPEPPPAHFSGISGIRAIVFDMDGTLVDSELNTGTAVLTLLSEHGVSGAGLDTTQFYGLTWQAIGNALRKFYPELKGHPVEEPLQETFHRLFPDAPYVPGALDFFKRAGAVLPVAIASSSQRQSVDYLLTRMDAHTVCRLRLSAEDYTRSKPDPECYLLAADKLGVSPRECLVFEDSIPGLQAAKSAGAAAIAVTMRSSDIAMAVRLADASVRDYDQLPSGFLDLIRRSASSQ